MTGILDTVLSSQQTEGLRSFNPQTEVLSYLEKLDSRESQILVGRYGLRDGKRQTLEQIGKLLHLTRERVRQIEKNSLKKLAAQKLPEDLQRNVDLIFQLIEDRGNIVREASLQSLLGQSGSAAKNSLLFILDLVPRFVFLKETDLLHTAWCLPGFDREIFDQVVFLAGRILRESKKALSAESFFEQIRSSAQTPEIKNLSVAAMESMASVSKTIDHNAYGKWGLASWAEINPGDVGDKAFLVLEHHRKPEHYSVITELINKQLTPGRTAHKETVHNELIKDERFVLVGRGIYALQKWGYKKGVVADVIADAIRSAERPLSRSEIIDEVLKQRLVKRNTIIVGLSNRQRFTKTPENKYTLTNNA